MRAPLGAPHRARFLMSGPMYDWRSTPPRSTIERGASPSQQQRDTLSPEHGENGGPAIRCPEFAPSIVHVVDLSRPSPSGDNRLYLAHTTGEEGADGRR